MTQPSNINVPYYNVQLPSGIVVPCPVDQIRARVGVDTFDSAVYEIVFEVLAAEVRALEGAHDVADPEVDLEAVQGELQATIRQSLTGPDLPTTGA